MTACKIIASAGLIWGAAAPAAFAHPPAHAVSAASASFGAQVRVIGRDELEAEGIGQAASAMAHERNAARAEAQVTATIVGEDPAKARPRGGK